MAIYRQWIDSREDDTDRSSVAEYEIIEGHERPAPSTFSLLAMRNGKMYQIRRYQFAGSVFIDPACEKCRVGMHMPYETWKLTCPKCGHTEE
jgi:hypothetical protein